jgi:GntR family transcriptional regulator
VLDRYSPIPLHYQLRTAIDARIDSGEWAPESQVPSERDLCEQFQVSRITVRQALSQLVNEGRLVRVRGRGTFVAQSPFKKCLLPLVGFTQDMLARGQKPGARVLKFEVAAPSPNVARALQIGDDEGVIVLKRLRLANDQPMAVETVHLPERFCPGLLRENLEDQSLYSLLRGRYSIRPTRALQQWQAVACPSIDAKLLGVRSRSPVLQIRRVTFEAEGRPFEYLESYFRGDRYIFYAELQEAGAGFREDDAAGLSTARAGEASFGAISYMATPRTIGS